MGVTKVIRWQTSDGKEHSSQEWAGIWEGKIDAAQKASDMLENGATMAECLRVIGLCPTEVDPILESVTKDTQLVISHWQCQDTPGYKVQRFNADGTVVVWGDAGAWSGPYGGDVKISSLVRYAKDRNTKLTVPG